MTRRSDIKNQVYQNRCTKTEREKWVLCAVQWWWHWKLSDLFVATYFGNNTFLRLQLICVQLIFFSWTTYLNDSLFFQTIFHLETGWMFFRFKPKTVEKWHRNWPWRLTLCIREMPPRNHQGFVLYKLSLNVSNLNEKFKRTMTPV